MTDRLAKLEKISMEQGHKIDSLEALAKKQQEALHELGEGVKAWYKGLNKWLNRFWGLAMAVLALSVYKTGKLDGLLSLLGGMFL